MGICLPAGQPTLLHHRRDTALYRINETTVKVTDGLMAGREGDILRLLDADPANRPTARELASRCPPAGKGHLEERQKRSRPDAP